MEERKRSLENPTPDTDHEGDLKLMDRRHFRAFSRADEYLYAMKEDLAEWLNMLYPAIGIEADTFMDKLENGEYLVKVRHQSYSISLFAKEAGILQSGMALLSSCQNNWPLAK